jgi:hypothetical protein
VPVCEAVTIDVTPVRVQGENAPVSNPPLTMPLGALPLTVSVKVVVCVAEVPVPVTVIAYVPPGVIVDVLTVNVDDPPEFTEVGLNAAVAPAGKPDAESDTDCAEPDVTAVEIVDVAGLPAFTVAEDGLAAIEKSFAATALTVSDTDVVCVADAPVPVTVIGYVPAGVEADVCNVNVDEPPEFTEVGLNDAVAPLGRPEADSDTDCAEPDVTAVEMVDVAEPPAVTVADDGLAEIEKSFVAARVMMQSLATLLNSFCTVYVTPSPPVTVPCCALQMSPISPLVPSYQASGGALFAPASPTSASVTASINSWDETDDSFWYCVPAPQPAAIPPVVKSGSTE